MWCDQGRADTLAAGTTAPGHIQSLVKAIAPAVKATKGQDAEATAKANERNVAKELRDSTPLLKEMVEKGAVSVVAYICTTTSIRVP